MAMLQIQIIPGYGPSLPIHLPRTHGRPVKGLSRDEQTWRQLGTVWPTKPAEHTKPPKGCAPTLGALGKFIDRVAEWNAIAETQFLELATVNQELAATGVSSYSLSSSSSDSDDDETMDTVTTGVSGTEYTTIDLAALTRRIEWERQIKQTSQPRKAALAIKDGKISVTARSHDLTMELLLPMAKRLRASIQGRTPEELQNDRNRVEFYGKIGSCLYDVWTGDHAPEQDMDDLGAEDQMEDESNGGPAELGLHVLRANHTARWEPSENFLWPDDVDATVIHSPEEWDMFWQERNFIW